MLQYGAELWGLGKASQYCEEVHLLALKTLLGLDGQTPNDLVYGELILMKILAKYKIHYFW